MNANGTVGHKREILALALLALLVFIIPIEYKYDKWLRHVSLALMPDGLILPKSFPKRICFYISDLIALFLFFFMALKTPWRRIATDKSVCFLGIFFLCAFLSVCNSLHGSITVKGGISGLDVAGGVLAVTFLFAALPNPPTDGVDFDTELLLALLG